MLMIVRYITMPMIGCQIVLFPKTDAFKWEKTLDKNKTFNLFIKRSIKKIDDKSRWVSSILTDAYYWLLFYN